MPDLTKIATCSYCGTRSVLRLKGMVQHELACSACGARLHNMKPIRADASHPPSHGHWPAEKPRRRPTGQQPDPGYGVARPKPARPRKRTLKARLGRLADVFDDILDEVEDIFD